MKTPLDAGNPGIELSPLPLAKSQPPSGSLSPPESVPAARLPLHSSTVTPWPGVPPNVGALTLTVLGVAQAGPYGAVLKLHPSALLRIRLTALEMVTSWRPGVEFGSAGLVGSGLPFCWWARAGPVSSAMAPAPTKPTVATSRRYFMSFKRFPPETTRWSGGGVTRVRAG